MDNPDVERPWRCPTIMMVLGTILAYVNAFLDLWMILTVVPVIPLRSIRRVSAWPRYSSSSCDACANRTLMKPTEFGVPLATAVSLAGAVMKCGDF